MLARARRRVDAAPRGGAVVRWCEGWCGRGAEEVRSGMRGMSGIFEWCGECEESAEVVVWSGAGVELCWFLWGALWW